jgi:hypothetical protein
MLWVLIWILVGGGGVLNTTISRTALRPCRRTNSARRKIFRPAYRVSKTPQKNFCSETIACRNRYLAQKIIYSPRTHVCCWNSVHHKPPRSTTSPLPAASEVFSCGTIRASASFRQISRRLPTRVDRSFPVLISLCAVVFPNPLMWQKSATEIVLVFIVLPHC